MPNSIDFDELLASARAGDERALGRLLDHFRSQLRMTIRAHIHGPIQRRIDESDIVQQVCVRAIQGFSQFQGATIDEFRKWLEQIQEHTLVDAVRFHNAQKRNAQQERSAAGPVEFQAHATSASQRAMRGERAERLRMLINELPEGQREALSLRYFENATVADIALELNRTDAAVASLLKRGVSAIRAKLGNETL